MEKIHEEMMLMTVWADSTHQYTETECDRDNMVDIELPRRLVYDYYKNHEAEFVAETMDELRIPKEECTFDKWAKEVYTCMDTDELFDYARMHGYEWKRSDEPAEWETSADGYEIEVCPECGAENEIRWDINADGFEAFCPHCGAKMMLCDACSHKYGECYSDCDWCEGKGCHMDSTHRKVKKEEK